jgi:hypothetical protein
MKSHPAQGTEFIFCKSPDVKIKHQEYREHRIFGHKKQTHENQNPESCCPDPVLIHPVGRHRA